MTNTTVTEPKPAPSVTFTELNVRQDKGKPHFIRLHDSVVKGLERHLKASTGDSSGLLLGSLDVGENCTISVEDFEPVASIEESVRSVSAGNVVGYYRTYAQAEFAPDTADRSLFQRSFPKDARLVLLVRPPKTDVGTAMFFLGESGHLTSDRATVEFPFNLRELGAEDASPAPAPAPVPVAKPNGVAKPVVAAKPTTPAPAPKPVAAAPVESVKPAAPSSVAAAKPAATAPAPAVAAKPVAENKPSGGGAFWKIAVAAFVVAGCGLGLNSLGVFNRQTASPVVVDNPAPALQEAAPAAPAPKPESPTAVTKAPQQETPKAAPKPAVIEASPKTPAPPVATRAEATRILPATQIERPAPRTSVDRSQPPAQTPAPETTPSATIPSSPAPRERNPEPTPPAVSRPAPTPSAPSTRAVQPAEQLIAPRAIRQFAPVMVDKVRRSIEGEMVAKVRVYVDATGKVTDIKPLTGGTPVADALAITAINAVRRWQFEPARRGDEKVAGDVELSFTFRK
jgi:TonB family protein